MKLFDRFFDCFNVRSLSEGIHERKPDRRPYRDPTDSRLEVSTLVVLWPVTLGSFHVKSTHKTNLTNLNCQNIGTEVQQIIKIETFK